jgi:hypothetical protein
MANPKLYEVMLWWWNPVTAKFGEPIIVFVRARENDAERAAVHFAFLENPNIDRFTVITCASLKKKRRAKDVVHEAPDASILQRYVRSAAAVKRKPGQPLDWTKPDPHVWYHRPVPKPRNPDKLGTTAHDKKKER